MPLLVGKIFRIALGVIIFVAGLAFQAIVILHQHEALQIVFGGCCNTPSVVWFLFDMAALSFISVGATLVLNSLIPLRKYLR